MYRLFLALRYLLTRPINLLGMAGITISVWALVVVVSLFSGFLQVVEDHVHAASADVSVTNLPPDLPWPQLRAALRDEPQVADVAPRLLHFGMLARPGRRPPQAPLPGRSALHGGDQPFLFVQGIDPQAEAAVSGWAGWVAVPAVQSAGRCPAGPLAAA
ncbi:MAG: ABC transporter permease, partial [Planctomycetota bacterium]